MDSVGHVLVPANYINIKVEILNFNTELLQVAGVFRDKTSGLCKVCVIVVTHCIGM